MCLLQQYFYTKLSSDLSGSTPRQTLRLGRHPKRLRDRVEDLVDVIDIEDEDHSFAAFFIGMKNGEIERNVKRPLVGKKEHTFKDVSNQYWLKSYIDFKHLMEVSLNYQKVHRSFDFLI